MYRLRHIILAVLIFCFTASLVFAQTTGDPVQWNPDNTITIGSGKFLIMGNGRTVVPYGTAFPTSPAPILNEIFLITDDSAIGACDSAGGSARTMCQWNGSAWVDFGQPAVTLDSNANANLLSLTIQQIGLDTQVANRVFVGPTSGGAAVPTFRALVDADIPDTITIAETNIDAAIARDSELPTQADFSVDDLITLSGVAEGATNLGTFTGTTISDSQTVKAALQDLETALEGTATHDAVTLSTDANNNLLSLSTQEIGIDNQSANIVFAGPSSGGAAAPGFRALVDDDIPDTVTLTNITQIANRSHTSLTDIGTNTHAQIDSHIAASSSVHGVSGSVVGTTGAQVLTDKELTNPTLGAAPSGMTAQIANEAGTGTSNNHLAKLTGAPSTAIITSAGDTSGIVGVVVSGGGTTGSAEIIVVGTGQCDFDGATTAGHFVQQSASVAGECTDAGATYPQSGQVIGAVLETIGAAGLADVFFYNHAESAGGSYLSSWAAATESGNAATLSGTDKYQFTSCATGDLQTISGTTNGDIITLSIDGSGCTSLALSDGDNNIVVVGGDYTLSSASDWIECKHQGSFVVCKPAGAGSSTPDIDTTFDASADGKITGLTTSKPFGKCDTPGTKCVNEYFDGAGDYQKDLPANTDLAPKIPSNQNFCLYDKENEECIVECDPDATGTGDGTCTVRDPWFAKHAVTTKTTATSYTIGTTSAREAWGGVIYVTGAATITAPAIQAGMSFTVITIGAVAVSVDVNAADRMYLDGTALDDGDKATNTSTTGDMIVCTYESSAGWYCTSNSWTDGGA